MNQGWDEILPIAYRSNPLVCNQTTADETLYSLLSLHQSPPPKKTKSQNGNAAEIAIKNEKAIQEKSFGKWIEHQPQTDTPASKHNFQQTCSINGVFSSSNRNTALTHKGEKSDSSDSLLTENEMARKIFLSLVLFLDKYTIWCIICVQIHQLRRKMCFWHTS